ncbi:MAG TPA: hypothetical protein VN442_14265 [Bryobacteraceae bacterium]|nr:hypothetical protein [Bryobacteraceae bacterium]
MKVTDIREAVGHAKRFLTHAEWVLKDCGQKGRYGNLPITITNVCGGPGYDVMQDAAQDLKRALVKFRKRQHATEGASE